MMFASPVSMLFGGLHRIVGELPQQGDYFNIFLVGVFALAFLFWAYTAVWVQQAARRVRLPQASWNLVVFGGGAISLAAWLLVPNFWAGLAIFAVVFGSGAIVFVVQHNQRVAPVQTVLTPAHMRRLFKGGGASSREVDSEDRVRLKGANGKAPVWPNEPEEHSAYHALQELLFDAIWRRANMVRLDLLSEKPLHVVYTIDGVDRAREPVDAEIGVRVFRQFKTIAGLNPDENRRPQQGRFWGAIGPAGKNEKKVDIDLKTSGSTAGQRILLTLLTEESKFRIADVGFTRDQIPIIEQLIKEPKGIVLCTGPKGSGVTSTLYAILRDHDAFIQNIHTLETVKAHDLDNISQHVFDDRGGAVSYGKQFRSVVRTEPDVLMAGDVPDTETFVIAAEAARMGKKLYLGFPAADTFVALKQFLQIVGNNKLAAVALSAVLNQRLVRIVCYNCRRAYKPDPNLLKKANLPLGENRAFYRPPKPDEVEVDKRGNPISCSICQGTGYLGRTAIFEVLVLNDEIRAHIARDAPLPALRSLARKHGMLNLQEIALHKVYEGVTSIQEVMRVTRDAAPVTATA